MSADLDVDLLRASFVQAQSQILNDGRFEPVVVVSKALALQLLDEIDRLRRWKAEATAAGKVVAAAFDRAGRPGQLGQHKAEAMADEIERLRSSTVRLAEAFVDVWSQPDPMARAVRGHQVFGKSFGHLYAGTADVDQVARALTRAIKRQP